MVTRAWAWQGADLDEVMQVVGSDSRIGSGYLKACPGMGYSCPVPCRARAGSSGSRPALVILVYSPQKNGLNVCGWMTLGLPVR